MLKEAVSDINRVGKILQIVMKNGFGDLLDRAKIYERLSIRRPNVESDQTRSPAQRLSKMLTELGPTFVKMGQLLSSRPDIIPESYVQALRTLQDQVPPFAYAQVAEIIRTDLGSDPQHVFKHFEKEPFASASIAQVHLATDQNERKLVVKIKRPDIEQIIRSDLDILYYLAHLLEAVIEESALYDPVEVVREFDRAIGLELNFQREAQNLEAFYTNFKERNNLVVPQPIFALSGPNVLTMCCVEGMHIEQIQPSSELARKAALNLIEGFYQQAFEDGLFHADPHPGNLRVLPDGRVGLFDFGQVGRLSATARGTMALLGLGIMLKDADTLSRLLCRLGSQTKRIDLTKFKKDLEETLASPLGRKLEKIDSSQLVSRLVDLSQRHQIRIPPEYLLLIKALATVEGTVRSLHPKLEPSSVALPYVQRMLKERYRIDDLQSGLLRGLLQLSHFLNETPQQLSQILLDLEAGRLSFNLRDPESPRLRLTLRRIGIDLFWGLIAVGLLTGSLPALMAPGKPPRMAVWGLLGAGLIAVTVTSRYFLTPLLRKLRLRSWLERKWDPKETGDNLKEPDETERKP